MKRGEYIEAMERAVVTGSSFGSTCETKRNARKEMKTYAISTAKVVMNLL